MSDDEQSINDQFQIMVWAQMFFNDGSVTQGLRVPAYVLDDELGALKQLSVKLLSSVNRQEGLLLVWGAGEIFHRYYIQEPNVFPSEGLDS